MEPGMIWVAGFALAALFFLLAAVELFDGSGEKVEPPTTRVDIESIRRDLDLRLCPDCGQSDQGEQGCLCNFEF